MDTKQVAVGVFDEELLDAYLTVADRYHFRSGAMNSSMPALLSAEVMGAIVGAQRSLQWGAHPVPTEADLFEHDVRGAECDVGEPFDRAPVADRESAEDAPKVQAAIKIGDEELRNQGGIVVLGHGQILAGKRPLGHSLCDVAMMCRLGGDGGGAFAQFALVENRAGTDQGDQVWGVDGSPTGLSGVDQLVGHRDTAAREPGPLVTVVRNRTVAKVDSIGLVVRRWIQCSAGYL